MGTHAGLTINLGAQNGGGGVLSLTEGQAGSLAVYHHLYLKHGKIDAAAAQEGLELYAEHAEDAELNPGKHPNIDRLYDVIAEDSSLQVSIHLKA